MLLWLSHWEKAQSQPAVRDGFASLNCSPHSQRAGAGAVNFTLCSACPAAGSLLHPALSCPALRSPRAHSVAPKEKCNLIFLSPPGFAVYSMFSGGEKAKRQPSSLLLAHSLSEEHSAVTHTKCHRHNSQALKHDPGIFISLPCVCVGAYMCSPQTCPEKPQWLRLNTLNC